MLNKKIQKENFKSLNRLVRDEKIISLDFSPDPKKIIYIEDMPLYHQLESAHVLGLISRRQFKCLRRILGISKVEWLHKHLDEKWEKTEKEEARYD
jgi:hypothetical protein